MATCTCQISWAEILTAVGTVGAVGVALFGHFLPKLFPPRLRIRIADPNGTPQRVQLIDQRGAIPVPVRDAAARYYHAEITNSRRWNKAHNVKAVLVRIEEETVAGWVDVWAGGGIPLTWQHQHMQGASRNVGPPALADLFHVVQDIDPAQSKFLELTPIFAPYGVELRYRRPCALRMTLQAQSDEADSSILLVIVRWNGQWHDGATEMHQHVRVEAG